MTRRALRSVWALARAPHPTGPGPRDWVLVAVVVVAAVLEGLLRTGVAWRPGALAMAVGLAFTLPWRRVRPLAMFATAFGATAAVQVASIAVGDSATVGLATGVYMLLLVYAVFRWGSGRECVAAAAGLVGIVALGFGRDYRTLADLLLEVAILTVPGVLAVAVRTQSGARSRELDQVRLGEREQLARELHDTVAHHVSAMVVRAQAGRLVAATDPDAAIEALKVIESEGSRTLAEMRVLVGALRDGDDPQLLAPRTVTDIPSLAGDVGGTTVTVEMSGDVEGVHPSVGAALYRIAQEAITNARRHATGATAVSLTVAGESDGVRLRVVDDGAAVTSGTGGAGFGIVGMTERVALLGGTLTAGPVAGRGWVVEAWVPRTGVRR